MKGNTPFRKSFALKSSFFGVLFLKIEVKWIMSVYIYTIYVYPHKIVYYPK